ncbi:serine palmitoyltransferase small subunit A [Lucilia sericata]|uniref:serine palmitoyltransferase small subunit A n=1 Tax=Lucilia sericata TaxID=13632 RepID=UPI0018A85829|nr:serine palmitoyltransferase small subunit A [Lucilia sericata]
MLKFIKKSLMSLYMQYELVTCIYMFEPWEKKLINSFVALILALVLFSSYVYLPSYIQTFLQFVTPLPLQQQNKVATASSYATPILQADKISIS